MADQFEYRLNATYTTVRMPVPFTPEVVFIYNPSNSTLYLNTTTYAIPTTTNYDLSIPAHAYTVFKPYTPNTEYGALLVPPAGDPILWDCWIEFRRGEKEIQWNVAPDFPVIMPLSPLPDPAVSALFSYEVLGATGYLWDFSISDFGFLPASDVQPGAIGCTYSPGVGWVSQFFLPSLPDEDALSVVYPPGSTWSGVVTYMGVGYQDNHASNPTGRSAGTSADNVGFPGAPSETAFNNNTNIHGSWFVDGTLPGAITAVRVIVTLSNNGAGNTEHDLILQYIIIRGTFTAPPLEAEPVYINVQFYDLSSGAVAAWFWDFGDGETSALQNPVHTYVYAGTYTVTLYAIGVFGTISSYTLTVYVNTVADEVFAFV